MSDSTLPQHQLASFVASKQLEHTSNQRKSAVLDLHHDATEALLAHGDVEQVENHRLLRTKQVTARHSEHERIRDLTGSTGDENASRSTSSLEAGTSESEVNRRALWRGRAVANDLTDSHQLQATEPNPTIPLQYLRTMIERKPKRDETMQEREREGPSLLCACVSEWRRRSE
mgnify:FL=1